MTIMPDAIYNSKNDTWITESSGDSIPSESHPDGWEHEWMVEFVETEKGLEAHVEDGGGAPLYVVWARDGGMDQLLIATRAVIRAEAGL